ncbi:hypothetical protein MY04_05635 [Flammeovirga sp. MY04]|uniref:hypothetical protein n=1 Tax=Flammeovirga sp. MY04 TaxID=1191459 RepID=UPI0008262AAB|nr:hypothetical protein [Flammeovirga sp. MY04]QJD09387.1 hypothetical protein MY04_05635 [Flammeovirga sp. MY04]
MNLVETIPKINKIGIILIISFGINILLGPFLTPIYTSIFTPDEYGLIKISVLSATSIEYTLSFIVRIILSVWIYKESKRQKESSIIWILMTLTFGLTAVILFYLFLLIKEMKILNAKIDEKKSDNLEL